jgi:hypothetical protein
VRTIDEHPCDAPPDAAFRVAADVEGWPAILPHYRWVRFHRKDAFAAGLVEMAAWRPFGPLRYPTWWISEMDHDPGARVVRYRHVRGVTTGMDVVWEVEPRGPAGSLLRIVHEWKGPGWPMVGGVAAELVIGPLFVRNIAGRTLAGIAAEAERRHRVGPR